MAETKAFAHASPDSASVHPARRAPRQRENQSHRQHVLAEEMKVNAHAEAVSVSARTVQDRRNRKTR